MMKTLIFIVFMVCVTTTHSQTVLRFAPVKGEKYTFKDAVDMDQSMQAEGSSQSTEMSTSVKMTVSVDNVDNITKESILTTTYGDMRLRMDGMGKKQDTTTNVMKSMKHTMNVKPNGTITFSKVEYDANAKGSNAAALKAMQSFGGNLGVDKLIIPYPTEPLTKGLSWNRSVNDTNNLGANLGSIVTTKELVYAYERDVDTLGIRCAVITGKTSKLTLTGKFKQMEMEMLIEGDGAMKILYYAEKSSGVPVAIITKTEIDQRMTIMAMDRTIPMTIDVKNVVVRSK